MPSPSSPTVTPDLLLHSSHFSLSPPPPLHTQEGEWVTRTPLSAVINIEHAFASEEFGPIADRLERTTSNTNLKALFLATERNRGAMSTWAPYLASLPRQISSSLSFDGHEIEELQASMVGLTDYLSTR